MQHREEGCKTTCGATRRRRSRLAALTLPRCYPPSTPLLLALAAILCATAPAQELPARCPLDGASVNLPGGGVWNTAGGEDSDGCLWAVEARQRWRIPILDEVVECGRCGGAWRVSDLGLTLTAPEREAIQAGLSAVGPLSSLPLAARHQRAAVCYRALAGRLPGLDGEMLLRAAWAARSGAVLQEDPEPAYRPRDPREALAQMAQLETRLAQGGRPSRIETMLGLVEQARSELETCGPGAPPDEIARERAQQALQRMEQELCALRAELPPEAAERSAQRVQGDLQLTLARACLRLGDPRRRERWLDLAALRLGARGATRVEALRRLCAEEARLLTLAAPLLRAAATGAEGHPAPQDPREQARLLYLAGDCARRCGEDEQARQDLERVRVLDPAGRPARWAAVLLGQ